MCLAFCIRKTFANSLLLAKGGILGNLWNIGNAWASGSEQAIATEHHLSSKVAENNWDDESEYQEDQIDEVTGLVGAHCYTVLAAIEVAADSGKSWFRKERWVRLRNPWGTGRWKGPTPKSSMLPFSAAVFDCVGEKVRRGSGQSDNKEAQDGLQGPMAETDPGTFWMQLADFADEFATVCVSEYRPGYISSVFPLKPKQMLNGAPTQVCATLQLLADAERTHLGDLKPIHVVVSVLQDSDEPFSRPKQRKFSSARIEVLESGRSQGSRHVASSSFGLQREVLLPVELKAGAQYLVIVHWLQASPVRSWNREATLRVYAPCPARLGPGPMEMEAQREAYEAAAMGPRGSCLKETQGAQLRCWSDRESGTIALCFDASDAPAGLLASLTWTLQNSVLQPRFPGWEGSVTAAGEEQHVQVVDLKPGQRQLTVVSWLDPSKAFSATYSWQATADPCSQCNAPVGTNVPGRFSGAYRVLGPSDLGGPATLHEECFEKFMLRVAPRCLQCSEAIVQVQGRFAGQYFAYSANQLGSHPAGQVHAECNDAFRSKFAKTCLHCREQASQHYQGYRSTDKFVFPVGTVSFATCADRPVMQLAGKFSGKHFNYKAGWAARSILKQLLTCMGVHPERESKYKSNSIVTNPST
ncbi:CAPN14 [Symbiodinium natans]|uniref:CAPN14 protein n=1 Tax=Symbiodinium natans TaxID=878477 RepID=A0A812JEU6_9DINO|nr:CAPN14 [Symbiodinium natans]